MEVLVEALIRVQEESDRDYTKLKEKLLEIRERGQKESYDFQLCTVGVKINFWFHLRRTRVQQYDSHCSI